MHQSLSCWALTCSGLMERVTPITATKVSYTLSNRPTCPFYGHAQSILLSSPFFLSSNPCIPYPPTLSYLFRSNSSQQLRGRPQKCWSPSSSSWKALSLSLSNLLPRGWERPQQPTERREDGANNAHGSERRERDFWKEKEEAQNQGTDGGGGSLRRLRSCLQWKRLLLLLARRDPRKGTFVEKLERGVLACVCG